MLLKRNIIECVFVNLVVKWWFCIKNNFNREIDEDEMKMFKL